MMLHDNIREKKVEDGLRFILNHFDDSEPMWPRMVSTYVTRGAQKLVSSFEEAMAWYKAANFLDCRMSAYPKYTDIYINSTGIAPSLLLVDIDREHFETTEQFELCAIKTIKNFKELLDAQPTQLWTGGGYHFILPQFAIVLEKVEKFKKFGHPSRDFMRFEEISRRVPIVN
jgi:hypothetical protein